MLGSAIVEIFNSAQQTVAPRERRIRKGFYRKANVVSTSTGHMSIHSLLSDGPSSASSQYQRCRIADTTVTAASDNPIVVKPEKRWLSSDHFYLRLPEPKRSIISEHLPIEQTDHRLEDDFATHAFSTASTISELECHHRKQRRSALGYCKYRAWLADPTIISHGYEVFLNKLLYLPRVGAALEWHRLIQSLN
ncbi:hypothetical protein EI94DRAFT_186001 [Lactarius quietus]|nr:hypothetical protein EI94DRAFT_186001 [Lactarius quietus]